MRFIFAPLLILADVVLVYALWSALPLLWNAALILGAITLAAGVVFLAVRAALRVG